MATAAQQCAVHVLPPQLRSMSQVGPGGREGRLRSATQLHSEPQTIHKEAMHTSNYLTRRAAPHKTGPQTTTAKHGRIHPSKPLC
jgi:hypothetical protein